MDQTPYSGVIAERPKPEDWLGSAIDIPRAPKSTQSFTKNGSIQYNQDDVWRNSCVIHGAMGAYSDLTGHVFTLAERKEIWDLAIKAGADPMVGWYIDAAMDLVRHWVADHSLPEVSSYRIDITSGEFYTALAMGYSVVTGYSGNAKYGKDIMDLTLDDTSFGKSTYGHCLRVAYSTGDAQDLVVDNYFGSKHNLYKVPTEHWKALVRNGVFFKFGYVFLLK